MIDAMQQVSQNYTNKKVDDIRTFFQSWGSTALGFTGMFGCDCITTAPTIIVYKSDSAEVYFGGRFAYEVIYNSNDNKLNNFMIDARNKKLVPTGEAQERYGSTKVFSCNHVSNERI